MIDEDVLCCQQLIFVPQPTVYSKEFHSHIHLNLLMDRCRTFYDEKSSYIQKGCYNVSLYYYRTGSGHFVRRVMKSFMNHIYCTHIHVNSKSMNMTNIYNNVYHRILCVFLNSAINTNTAIFHVYIV